jgi:hypothetical protein
MILLVSVSIDHADNDCSRSSAEMMADEALDRGVGGRLREEWSSREQQCHAQTGERVPRTMLIGSTDPPVRSGGCVV